MPTADIPLDGLWYPPAAAPRAAVMLMHGNGGNFYSGPGRFLPRHLVPRGYACFAYNRRGHDTLTSRTREPEGNAFQTAGQATADNVTARDFVAARGSDHFYTGREDQVGRIVADWLDAVLGEAA